MTCNCHEDELVWCRRCWRWETLEQREGPGVRAPLGRRVRRLLAWPFSVHYDFWSAVYWAVRGEGVVSRSGIHFRLRWMLRHTAGLAACVWLNVLGDDVGPAVPPPPGYYQPNYYPYAYPERHRECERLARR